MVEEAKGQRRARGMRDVLMVIVAAGLMVAPSYFADLALRRLKLDIGIAAVMSLVLFLIGAFLLVRLVAE